jgi:hypothetical protein
MPDGASYVSSRPAIRLNGTANSDMVNSLLDIAVRAPETGMASAELRLVNWGIRPAGRSASCSTMSRSVTCSRSPSA